MNNAKTAKPKLLYTENLDLFVSHEHNRPLHRTKALFESMKRYNFMPSSPIQCREREDGKLTVIRGHHRLCCAKTLGIGVWYVIDETVTDLPEVPELEDCPGIGALIAVFEGSGRKEA